MTTYAFVEWPEGLKPHREPWDALQRQVEVAQPDILVTNELPFGSWLASTRTFDEEAAARSIELHDRGVEALRELGVPAIISSRLHRKLRRADVQ